MNIHEIANTIIRGEKAIVFPLKNHNGWISDQNGHHILDIRGWGFLQYADNDKEGQEFGTKGAELQDGIANWVVETLNKSFFNK